MKTQLKAALGFAMATLCIQAQSSLPTSEEMWKIIQKQQKEIKSLRQAVQGNKKAVTATQKEVAATADALEGVALGESGGVSWTDKTSLGGYGELHYNIKQAGDDKIDFHRFVLFINHDFSDNVSLFSEVEIEHTYAGGDEPGYVELEQAYIEHRLNDQWSYQAGLFLVPVGILNETHEPDTFFGVERNNVEKYIIPTTWWEGGVKVTFRPKPGVSIEGGLISGLDVVDSTTTTTLTQNSDNVTIDSNSVTTNEFGYFRGGRQKVASALANNWASVARVKFTAIPGLELAGTVFYQNDLVQSETYDQSGLLTSIHAVYQKDGFGLRALYAGWDVSGDDLDEDAKDQSGIYIEPSYKWNIGDTPYSIGVYARYSDLKYFKGTLSEKEYLEYGVSFYPAESVVFKADLVAEKDGDDTINLGVGYQF